MLSSYPRFQKGKKKNQRNRDFEHPQTASQRSRFESFSTADGALTSTRLLIRRMDRKASITVARTQLPSIIRRIGRTRGRAMNR